MNLNDFVTGDQILSDVLVECQDEGLRIRSKGWYMSQIQQALEELSFDTFFQKGMARILKVDTTKLQVEMPTGMFNIQEMYAFNCCCETDDDDPDTCDLECECCETSPTVKVYWKRQYNNQPKGGKTYTASRKEAGTVSPDPIMPYDSVTNGANTSIYKANLVWANIQNGIIMLSSSASGYNRLKVIYTGIMCDIGETPFIPKFFRQAVKDFVCTKFYAFMKAREPRTYRVIWADYKNELDTLNMDGSWHKARKRAASMDAWEKETMREYLGRPNI